MSPLAALFCSSQNKQQRLALNAQLFTRGYRWGVKKYLTFSYISAQILARKASSLFLINKKVWI